MWLIGWALAADTLEVLDADGHVVRRTITEQGVVQSEAVLFWDDDHLVRQETRAAAGVTEETWAYDGDDVTWVSRGPGGEEIREVRDFDGGRLVSVVRTDASGVHRTSVSYDAWGRESGRVVTAADGQVLSRVERVAPAPVVPVDIAVSAGVGFQSDVQLVDFDLGFALSRKPLVERHGLDPWEWGIGVRWAYARSRGEEVNNALNVHAGVDANLLLPRLTPFMFVDVDRNPVFNQQLDLELAPIGLKVDLIPRSAWRWDFSLAPIWNWRSIIVAGDAPVDCLGVEVAPGAACETSKLRASARMRLRYAKGPFSFGDTVEYVPTVVHAEAPLPQALSTDSILRNTFTASLQLTKALRIREEVGFTRDLTLARQTDCSVDPGSLLCQGMVLTQKTLLDISWSVP